MLLQTNSYIVPKDKRAEHARLVRRFRQTLARLGCEHFEVYEQVGSNWSGGESTGRYVHIMRFRDRKHQLAVQAAERNDPGAQALINEFCELINFPYQQQQGLFAVGFYQSVLPVASARPNVAPPDRAAPPPPTGDDLTPPSSSADDVEGGDVEGGDVAVDPSDAAAVEDADADADADMTDSSDDVPPEIDAEGTTIESAARDGEIDEIDDDDTDSDEPSQRQNA
ncbi:MAG: hypothetical protein WBD40_07490 [Tepidisphaeraceae bacterium]